MKKHTPFKKLARTVSELMREADRRDAPSVVEAQLAWTDEILGELADRNKSDDDANKT